MKIFLNIFFFIFVSSCSSLAFWKNEEIDPTEPRELLDFDKQVEINIKWKKKFKGSSMLNNLTPDFSGNNLYFADSEGTISALNINTGDEIWNVNIDTEIVSGITAGFGKLIVGDNDGNIICLDQQSGEMLWRSFAGGEVLSKVSIDASLIVVKTASGFLNAFNINNGNPDWSYRSQTPILTVRGSSAPIIDDAFVYATFDNGRLGAFSLKTGLPIWDGAISYTEGVSELENLIDADSTPVIEGNRIFTVNFQGNLAIFDIAQRRAVWNTSSSSFYPPFFSRGIFGIITPESKVSTFSSRSFAPSWENNDYSMRNISNPEVFKGNVIFGDFEGYIHILDPLTGLTIGREKISRNRIVSIVARTDAFYAVDEKLNLFSLDF